MAFADRSVYHDIGDGSIKGSFTEKENKKFFEFSTNHDSIMSEYPHKIWVTTPRPGIDSGFRYGMVKKTVAYLVVDEVNDGEYIVEKWYIKEHREYHA